MHRTTDLLILRLGRGAYSLDVARNSSDKHLDLLGSGAEVATLRSAPGAHPGRHELRGPRRQLAAGALTHDGLERLLRAPKGGIAGLRRPLSVGVRLQNPPPKRPLDVDIGRVAGHAELLI